MLLSGHQPVYLPGIILFNKIALSDAFMFVGHNQYVRKSWHSRNHIRNQDKKLTLSVPVKKKNNFGNSINDTELDGDHWKRRHLASIRGAYLKRPYFDQYFPVLEAIINKQHQSIGDLNMDLIRQCLEWMDIDTPIYDSRDFKITGEKTNMLISMCEATKATSYLSNLGSHAYLDEPLMEAMGLKHLWQDFSHPTYDQGASFLENLSAIDLLFNVGPSAGDIVKTSGKVVDQFPAQANTPA